MINYFLKRLGYTIPVLLIVSIFIFLLFYVMPGDPALNMVGENATAEVLEQTRTALGLAEPIHIRFWIWLKGIASGNFGTSIFSGMPVTTLIAQRLEPSISLAICAIILTIVISIPLGVAAAWKSRSVLDRSVMAGAVIAFSVPGFFIGYVVVMVFSLKLGWLPVQGFVSISEGIVPFLRHMILPSFTVSLSLIALLTRVTRATMLEVLSQDYIRTAHAKGLPPLMVLAMHALKNASIPIVTILSFAIALLLGGVIVTETVFAIPGVGVLTVDAITRRDYPVIQGVVLVFALIYIAINLIIDLSYPLLDPRIRK
jgi:peptide/nickel transport system permease protein